MNQSTLAPANREQVEAQFPAGETTSIQAGRINDSTCSPVAFAADSWPLHAMYDPDHTGSRSTIHFATWPDNWRLSAKHFCWALINYGTPEVLREAESSTRIAWPHPSTIHQAMTSLKSSAKWFDAGWPLSHRGHPPLASPAELDCEHLNDLRKWVQESAWKPETKNSRLDTVVLAAALSLWLPEDCQWPTPDWASDFRIPTPTTENSTARLAQSTMGPLLEWGIAFVTTFADDILRATAHYQERLAQEGLSFLVGSEPSLRALGVAPSALFRNENQWLPDFTVDDFRKSRPQEHLPLMLRLLHTACLIVAAYLTGARGDEIHQWRFGCAPAPHLTPEGALLHRIHGTTKKGREQADLATWATVPEATQAIHIAEQVQRAVGHTDGLVFGATPNRRLNAGTVRNRLQEFVDVVNSRLVPHTTHPKAFAIPSDPHGPLGLRRFRRTLAWFIRNQPGGHVTLALQYQHLSSRMGSGYAGTQEAGFNDLLLEEDWEHRRRTLDRLASILAEGAGIGGPAAARAIEAAARLPRPLTSGDERRLRKDQTLMIYDNPAAVALCVYRAHNALCEKTRFANSDAAPDLVGCVDGCPNCARTDDHIGDLRIKANRLRAHAETQPIPIARSLITQAERCERLAEQSQDTRLVANLNLSDQSSSPEIRSHDAPANPQGMPKLVLDAVLTDSSSAELPQTSRSPRRNSQSGAKPNLRSHSE